MSAYYVYIYRDPRDGNPIYVGLGKGKRAFKHWKKKANNIFFQNVLNKIRDLGLSPLIEFAAIELSFEEAAKMERELIALYGRRDLGLGCLCNLTDGGDGCHGLIVSDYAKRVHSEITKKRFSDPNERIENGKRISAVFAARTEEEMEVVRRNVKASRTPEVRAKIGAAAKVMMQRPEIYAKVMAAIRAPYVRKRQGETLRKTLAAPEQRQKKRDVMANVLKNPEYKRKMSEALKAKWQDPEYRARVKAGVDRRSAIEALAVEAQK